MESDQPNLNRRGEQYVGRVNVDDSSWRIEGADMEAGSKVKVTGVNGSTLMVEGAE